MIQQQNSKNSHLLICSNFIYFKKQSFEPNVYGFTSDHILRLASISFWRKYIQTIYSDESVKESADFSNQHLFFQILTSEILRSLFGHGVVEVVQTFALILYGLQCKFKVK